MNYWPLLGVAAVVLGFVLRLNPAMVVVVAGFITGAAAGLDPFEVRRKNFITTDMFPYTTPVALIYDTGNYQATLDKLIDIGDFAGFEKRRAASAAKVASSTPPASPRQPAWAAATRVPARSQNSAGRQSAVIAAQAMPGVEVQLASAVITRLGSAWATTMP